MTAAVVVTLTALLTAVAAAPQVPGFGMMMPIASMFGYPPPAVGYSPPAVGYPPPSVVGYPQGYPPYPYASAYPYNHHGMHGLPFGWHGFHGGYGHPHGYHHHHGYHGPPMHHPFH